MFCNVSFTWWTVKISLWLLFCNWFYMRIRLGTPAFFESSVSPISCTVAPSCPTLPPLIFLVVFFFNFSTFLSTDVSYCTSWIPHQFASICLSHQAVSSVWVGSCFLPAPYSLLMLWHLLILIKLAFSSGFHTVWEVGFSGICCHSYLC